MNGQKNSMSKAEKKRQKKREREERRAQERKQYARKKRTKRILQVGAVVVVLLFGYFLLFDNDSNNLDTSNGVLRLSTETVNFGPVSVQAGMVQQEIPLFNIGEEDLTITGLDSSCGCTTASIINEGEEGPIFQMANHGRNPTNWETIIPPGGQASLKIYYNPRTHPTLRGSVTRVITIFSDGNKRQEVRISVNQVD